MRFIRADLNPWARAGQQALGGTLVPGTMEGRAGFFVDTGTSAPEVERDPLAQPIPQAPPAPAAPPPSTVPQVVAPVYVPPPPAPLTVQNVVEVVAATTPPPPVPVAIKPTLPQSIPSPPTQNLAPPTLPQVQAPSPAPLAKSTIPPRPGGIQGNLWDEVMEKLYGADRALNEAMGGDGRETVSAAIGRDQYPVLGPIVGPILNTIDPGHTQRAAAGSIVNCEQYVCLTPRLWRLLNPKRGRR